MKYPDNTDRVYIAIDMKSFYASVECVSRGLDPLKALLLVADESRSDATIVLAVSPALKAMGVPSRPRLFEAKEKIRQFEAVHNTKVKYIIATPRMAEYEKASADIYGVILKYCAPEDVHVYSVDESFIDATGYLHHYMKEAHESGLHPAHVMAMTIIRDILGTTGITATVGIGTNLYLAKIAMDIVAKKAPPDKDGVRIAELNEDSYKYLLWDHFPLTDFWQIGPGKAKRLNSAFMYTMGDIAEKSLQDEEWFYKVFGIDGEIIIDHAWGIEPVTMADIKSYHTCSHSLSKGQVLPRPYCYSETRIVMTEMIDDLCYDMFGKNLLAPIYTWWVAYDPKSLTREGMPVYRGSISADYMGRAVPKHSNGSVRFPVPTNSFHTVSRRILKSFDEKVGQDLLFRRLGISADSLVNAISTDKVTSGRDVQMNLLGDYDSDRFKAMEDMNRISAELERENNIQQAMLDVRKKYGTNSIVKGFNMLEGATAMERNV
ncbi:MAG: DNA methylase, partial [Clostridiales bacterium]|nr:DNA methylase [Clostridiales bacterium]